MKSSELKIGKVLKILMKRDNITARELAKKLSIPPSTLFGYTQGVMPNNSRHLRALCRYFDITADHLLFNSLKLSTEKEGLKKGEVFKGTFKVIHIEKT